jgi:DNA-binding IclR family transcriptional regulator
MSGNYHLESVDRVMKVLNAFTPETPELRLTDLSAHLNLPKPQVLRLVATLESGGYLDRDPETKRYRLGIRIFQLGMIVRDQIDIRRFARPVMESVAEETLETVALFAQSAQGAICVDVIDSPRGLRVFAHVGRPNPWNAGTSSKVILAHLPEEHRERILSQSTFKRYTDATITDPAELRTVLDQIRTEGYHVAVRDLDEDALGVAAPIFDHDGKIAGAIGVAAPISRVSEGDLAGIVQTVRRAAVDISRQLGCPHVEGSPD